MNNNIGYCGLDCSKCETYIATINNDDDLRKEVAAKWSKLNNVEIPPQAINCLGCKQDGIKSVFCEQICMVRKCAVEEKLESCKDCKNMKGCKKLEPFLHSEINTFNK